MWLEYRKNFTPPRKDVWYRIGGVKLIYIFFTSGHLGDFEISGYEEVDVAFGLMNNIGANWQVTI